MGQWNTTQYLYIIADNGNYVTLESDRNYSWSDRKYKYLVKNGGSTVIDSNKGGTKSEFTRDEIKALVNLAAANYTQDADGKDKGQWRVPNQRELALMLGYWSELGMPTNGIYYASGTFFTATKAEKPNPFLVVPETNPYMSLYKEYSGDFRIRPVRDVEPSASPQATHDSSYRPGGSIIK